MIIRQIAADAFCLVQSVRILHTELSHPASLVFITTPHANSIPWLFFPDYQLLAGRTLDTQLRPFFFCLNLLVWSKYIFALIYSSVEVCQQLLNQNRKKRCSPWLVSPGNIIMQLRRQRRSVIEREVKKKKRVNSSLCKSGIVFILERVQQWRHHGTEIRVSMSKWNSYIWT